MNTAVEVSPCPVCNFEMKETRGCTLWCSNCGWKGTCGEIDMRDVQAAVGSSDLRHEAKTNLGSSDWP